jgi:hypothetical protein
LEERKKRAGFMEGIAGQWGIMVKPRHSACRIFLWI